MSSFVEGVRDLLPGEVRERKWIYQRLRETFALSGYQEVVTPTLESLELYEGTETLFLKEELFKVVDENGQILVLKPDVTMPITRLVATQYSQIPKPWKFSYITTAYSGNSGQSVKMKEKTQAGIELMGFSGLLADAEVISLLIEVLKQVGINNPLIDIGHAALVEKIFQGLQLSIKKKQKLRRLMDEKNVQEISSAIKNWSLTSAQQKIIITLPKLFGEPDSVLMGLKKLPLDEKALAVVRELTDLYQLLRGLNICQQISFDPCMMTNLGYYTGTIFKAYIPGYGEMVASGGRYDGLAKKFGQDVTAVGFAVEIERLLSCLKKFRLVSCQREPRIVFEISAKEDFLFAQQLAEKMRCRGVVVEIINQLNLQAYCHFHQIPFFCRISNGNLRLRRFDDDQEFFFSGGLKALSQKLEVLIKGGQDDGKH